MLCSLRSSFRPAVNCRSTSISCQDGYSVAHLLRRHLPPLRASSSVSYGLKSNYARVENHLPPPLISKTTQLHVANIPYGATSDELFDQFRIFEGLEKCAVHHRPAQPSYGFAIFKTAEAATKALNAHIVFRDRELSISESVGGRRSEPPQQLNEGAPSNMLFLRNLRFDTDKARLREVLKEFDGLVTLNILKNADGTSRGFAFVSFVSTEVASAVRTQLRENGLDIDGRVIDVGYAQSHPSLNPMSHKRSSNTLYIHRCRSSEEELRVFFSPFRHFVRDVSLKMPGKRRPLQRPASPCPAYIVFRTTAIAKTAYKVLNGTRTAEGELMTMYYAKDTE